MNLWMGFVFILVLALSACDVVSTPETQPTNSDFVTVVPSESGDMSLDKLAQSNLLIDCVGIAPQLKPGYPHISTSKPVTKKLISQKGAGLCKAYASGWIDVRVGLQKKIDGSFRTVFIMPSPKRKNFSAGQTVQYYDNELRTFYDCTQNVNAC